MRFKYIEHIWRNVNSVDYSTLIKLHNDFKESDCIIAYGSGRSYSAIKIAMSQFSKMYNSPIIITPEDTGFPGNTMYEALNILTRRYNRVLLLINSGSGTSEEPLTISEDFARYIEENGNDKLKMVAITSKEASPIGVLAKKYGYIVNLKGRDGTMVADFLTSGIMGDTFELGSLMVLQAIIKSIHLGDPDNIRWILKEYYDKIVEYMLEYVDSDMYNSMIDILARRSNVFIGGRGSAHEVATMLVIRLNHIKYAVGDHVYRARGSNTPRPRPGDMGLLISCSGENPTVIKWAENLSLSRTHLFGVVGRSESSLAKIIKNRIVLESRCIEPGVPRDFYMYASFVLSPLPIKLIERFREEGLNLPESILRYYHSTVE